MDRKFMFMKNICPQGVVCPCPGAIYMYINIIFKHLFKNRLASQSQTLCGASLGRGNESLECTTVFFFFFFFLFFFIIIIIIIIIILLIYYKLVNRAFFQAVEIENFIRIFSIFSIFLIELP